MRVLRNTSIRARSVGSTLIGSLVLAAVAALAIVTLLEVNAASEKVRSAISLRVQALVASNDLSLAQAALYRTINLQMQNAEIMTVRASKGQSAESVRQAREMLTQVPAGLAINPTVLPATVAALNRYDDAAKQVASFVEEDTFAAMTFMTDAAQKYQQAMDALAALRAASDDLSGRMDRQMTELMHRDLIVIPTVSVVAVIGSIIAAMLFGRLISRPIVAMSVAMRSLAGGELDLAIPAADQTDEVGQMAQALAVFRAHAQETRALHAAAESEHAAKAGRVQHLESLVTGFEVKVAQLLRAFGTASTELGQTAGTMAASASAADRQAATVADAARGVSSSVQTVGAAAEQLTASIGEITQQVTDSARMAGGAVNDARQADAIIRNLAQSSEKIGAVITLIQQIAGQTNLLALNATIEAARAGDAGKGFAVVASEVKSLARETGKATEEISGQIGEIQTATGQAVTAIGAITAVIEELNATCARIAAAIEQQGTATTEIARNIQQAAANTETVTASIGDVSRSADETGVAAQHVREAAAAVANQADRLSQEVGEFVAGVRAA